MRMQLLELAQANVDKHIGDVAGEYETEEELNENIYDEVYVLAFDALADEGVEFETAAKIAKVVAEPYRRK